MIKLGDVISLDKTIKVDIQDNIEYTIAGVQSYGKGVLNKRKELGINMTMKQYQLIEPNQLMWCKVDTKNGAFGITKSEHKGSLASTNMCLAKIKADKILPEFLEKLFRIKFFHENITHLSSGTTNRKYLTPNQLCDLIYIPNFTIQEQKDFLQFVNKLENSPIFSHIDYQLTQLENLNQAILQEAVQGKLVKQDPKDEPATELLKRINAEKAKSGKKEKSLPPIKPEEIPFEIPENWMWCRLCDIISILGDGLHGTPNYDPTGEYYFINGNNLINGRIEMKDTTKRVSESEYLKHRKPLIQNTVFVSINGTLGNLAYYNGEKIILGKSACYFNLHQDIVREYIGIYIKSSYFLKYAVDVASETTIKNVSLKSMRLLPIPLPPLSEQKRIVAEIEKQLAKTKQLKEHIIANQQATEQLLKALLHQAFEVGEKEGV